MGYGVYTAGNEEVAQWVQTLKHLNCAIDDNAIIAHDDFVSDLKLRGVWPKMKVINTFCYSALNAANVNAVLALVPLLPGPLAYSLPWTIVNPSPTVDVNGYKSTAAQARVITPHSFFNVFADANDAGASFYYGAGSIGPAVGPQVFNGGPSYTYIFGVQVSTAGGNWTVYNINVANAWTFPSLPAPSYGFYSFSRTASNLSTAYSANSGNAFASIATSAGVTAAASNNKANIYLFQGPLLNSGWWNTTMYLSFYALHLGLTSGETQDLYNAVQALRVALGGGYA